MRSSDIKPKKTLGQNFLINQGILDKIIQAAEISPQDTVIEVGPGTGNLTRKLSEKAGRVIAIEKDHQMVEFLKNELSTNQPYVQNVEIVEGDVLKFDPSRYLLLASGYKVVANIPYYITSHFLRTLLEEWPTPKLIVLTIQKEVAQRMTAKKGGMNLLALSVQLYSDPEIIMTVSKGSFRPTPKVDSAVIRLTPNPKANTETIKRVLELARKAFSGKRKQLKNTLKGVNLAKSDIPPETRPEDLSVPDWLKLSSEVK